MGVKTIGHFWHDVLSFAVNQVNRTRCIATSCVLPQQSDTLRVMNSRPAKTVMMAMFTASTLLGAPRALAQNAPVDQPFCIREGCLSGAATFGAIAVPANPADDANIVTFDFAYGEEGRGDLVFLTTHRPIEPVAVRPPTTSPVVAGPVPGTRPEMSIARGGFVGLTEPVVATDEPNGGIRAFHVRTTLRNDNFFGPYSDPVTSCGPSTCIALGRMTSGATDFVAVFPDGSATRINVPGVGGAIGRPAARPALLYFGRAGNLDQYLLVTRLYFAGGLMASGLAVLRIGLDRVQRTTVYEELRTYGLPSGNDFSAVGATLFGSTLVVAYANGAANGSVHVGGIVAANPQPVVNWQTIATNLPDVPFVGVAKSANNVVVSVQSGGLLWRSTVFVAPNSDLATRPINGGRDLLVGSVRNPVFGHSLVDGPVVLATFDDGAPNAPVRRARAALVSGCRDMLDCVLPNGPRPMCGACVANECANWRECPAGVDAGVEGGLSDASYLDARDVTDVVALPDARAVLDVMDVMDVMEASISTAGDAMMESSSDALLGHDEPAAPSSDSTAPAQDTMERDASSGQPMDEAPMPLADARAQLDQPTFGGGSCQCATSANKHSQPNSPTGALLWLGAAFAGAVRAAQRRRTQAT